MKEKYLSPLSVLLSSLLIISLPAHAVQNKYVDIQGKAVKSSKLLVKEFNLTADYDFKSVNEVHLPNGKIKNKFVETYKGIPVMDATVAATKLNNGQLKQITGTYLANIEKDIPNSHVKISKKEAINIAMKKMEVASLNEITNVKSDLYVKRIKAKANLVYKVSYMKNGKKPERPYFLIDAMNGKILKQWDGLTTSKASQLAGGPGGNEKTGQYVYGIDYPFFTVNEFCQMDTTDVETYNYNNSTTDGVLFQFTCPTNTYKYTNGAFSPLNDAHSFGIAIFNMYRTWFGIPPLATKLRINVHYGENYENLFFDGRAISIGDGESVFYPLTAIDMMAHEVAHGFTELNSGLDTTGQSGAISESYGDVAGEAAKYYFNIDKPVKNDWLYGGTVLKNDVAIRYISNPPQDGESIDTFRNYYENLDPHYSSGIFNKAFYNLATTANWDTRKAFEVFTLANQIYWHNDSHFVDAACGIKRAAEDYGYFADDVVAAFAAVDLDASCGPAACMRNYQTMTIDSFSIELAPGESGELELELFNNDTPACPATNYSIFVNSAEPRIIAQSDVSQLSLTGGQHGEFGVNVLAAVTARPGTYKITITASNITVPGFDVSVDADVVVTG